MKETLKRIKADIIVSALLCIALGIVLLVWPAETIDVFCKILAVGLIIMGGVDIASYFMNRSIHPFAGALGLIVLLIGIWIFLRPESIVSLIPIVIGVPRNWKSGIPTSTPQLLASLLLRLPPILYIQCQDPMPSCSKALRGLLHSKQEEY